MVILKIILFDHEKSSNIYFITKKIYCILAAAIKIWNYLKKKMFCYWYCPINIFIYQYLGALVPKSKYDQNISKYN